MTMRRVVQTLVTVAVLVGGGFAVMRLREAEAATSLPTAPARKGEFLVITRCRGELHARRSVQITAPTNVPDLRVMWLAPQNSAVKEGDVVIRFDGSGAKQQLQEKEAALQQAAATLEQAEAEARITAEADKRELSSAGYDLEKARLEVSRQEILSAIQGEEAKINLGLSENKLKVQKATVGLHEASGRSKLASLARVRDQAQYEVDLTKDRLAKMEVKTPLTGVIIYMPNYSAGWMNAKPFKVGDQAWPGATLAEIPDLKTLEMESKVEEIDRGRISVGNDVRLRMDALPELTIPAKLDELSQMTQASFDWPPTFNFRAYAKLADADARLRPEMNGSMDVVIRRIPDAISVPAKAVFTKNGKPIVYVQGAKGYAPREVTVEARNPDEVAVSGLAAGTAVALVEPEVKK